MMLIAGTVPIKDLPLTMGKVSAEGEHLIVDGHRILVKDHEVNYLKHSP